MQSGEQMRMAVTSSQLQDLVVVVVVDAWWWTCGSCCCWVDSCHCCHWVQELSLPLLGAELHCHCVGEVIIVSIVALWWSELVVVTVVSWGGLGIGHISHEWSAWVAGLHGVCGVGVHATVGW